jgi:hypothetical protein
MESDIFCIQNLEPYIITYKSGQFDDLARASNPVTHLHIFNPIKVYAGREMCIPGYLKYGVLGHIISAEWKL